MKKLKILSILLFGILAFACKKDNTDNPPNTDTNLTRFYSVEEAAEDALMLTSLDSSRSIMLIAYAAFDADGIPARINSLVLGKVAENYQGNLIFDEQKRPQLFYVTAKNGTKDNVLLSFSYPANDTVVYRFYYYDWSTQEDSLFQQQKTNLENFNSTFTYGNRLAEVAYWNKVADELETVHNNMEKVFNTEIVIKAVSDTRFNTQNLANFLETTADANRSNARIAFSAILYKYLLKLEQDRVHAQLAALSPEDFKNMKVVVHPKGLIPKAEYIYPKESKSLINYIYALFGIGSPTAEAATIPKPIGTPENPNGLPSTGTVTDIDGNAYKTIKIGDQIWMAENLKTSKYNDGTEIPNVIDDEEWETLTEGAYTYYNKDANHNATYGKLYNWHAVNTGKLCPQGWHIPTDAEWTQLINYLGEDEAGQKMKSTGNSTDGTGLWDKDLGYEGTNESGFSGLPGGHRYGDGSYGMGAYGGWWSSTEGGTDLAWGMLLFYDYNEVDSEEYNKNYGFSCRCARD